MKLFNRSLDQAWVDIPKQEGNETAAEYIQPYRAVDVLEKRESSYAQF